MHMTIIYVHVLINQISLSIMLTHTRMHARTHAHTHTQTYKNTYVSWWLITAENARATCLEQPMIVYLSTALFPLQNVMMNKNNDTAQYVRGKIGDSHTYTHIHTHTHTHTHTHRGISAILHKHVFSIIH